MPICARKGKRLKVEERVSVTDAARLLGVSVQTVRNSIRKGGLKAEKVRRGRREVWEIPVAEVRGAYSRSKLARELAQCLAESVSAEVKKILLEQEAEILGLTYWAELGRKMGGLQREIGALQARLEIAKNEADRLRRDNAALAAELRKSGVRREDLAEN